MSYGLSAFTVMEPSTLSQRIAVCDNLWELYPAFGTPDDQSDCISQLHKAEDPTSAYQRLDEVYARVMDRLMPDIVDIYDGIETVAYQNPKQIIAEILGQLAFYKSDTVPVQGVYDCARRLAIWEIPIARQAERQASRLVSAQPALW